MDKKNQVKNLVRKVDGEVMLDTSMWTGYSKFHLKTAEELTTEEVWLVLEVLYSYQNAYWELSERMKARFGMN